MSPLLYPIDKAWFSETSVSPRLHGLTSRNTQRIFAHVIFICQCCSQIFSICHVCKWYIIIHPLQTQGANRYLAVFKSWFFSCALCTGQEHTLSGSTLVSLLVNNRCSVYLQYFCMVLKLGYFGNIWNTSQVLKCSFGEGWRRSVGPIVREMKYYVESRRKGMSYTQ